MLFRSYSKATSDVEVHYPWGWAEVEGIAHRGAYDLTQHATHSGKKLTYFDPDTNEHIVPHVVEPAAGVARGITTDGSLLVEGADGTKEFRRGSVVFALEA